MKFYKRSRPKFLTLHFISFAGSRGLNDLTCLRANIPGKIFFQVRKEDI